jgi:hypothetical protein
LGLEHIYFTHPLRLRDCTFDAPTDLSGATIKELDFSGSHMQDLILIGTEVQGHVIVAPGSVVGTVNALGARINGQLSLADATIRNPNGGYALVLDSANITAGVCAEKLTADGGVRALGAQINGQLHLDEATLQSATGNALMLDSANITGEVFANKLTANGQVSATNAHVEKNFELSDATLRNPTGHSLTFAGASIDRLILEPSVNEGSVRLYRAKIGDLITADLPPSPLIASGWEVSDIHGPLRGNVNLAMNWLDTNSTIGTPDQMRTVQPWHAIAAAYERNGDPASARKLRYAAAKKVTAQSSGFTKIAGWVYDALVGHGYHPLRALWWLGAIVLVGWLVVALSQEDIVPANMKDAVAAANTQPAATGIAASPFTARTPCSSHPTYPCEESFTFAFNALAPASVGSPDAYWTVKHDAYWLTVVLEVLRIFGWVLAALLIAGATGLLRKT